MRIATRLAAAAFLFAATPAFATSSIHCQTRARSGVELYLSVGTGPGFSILSAHLVDGRVGWTTGATRTSPMIAQAWLDNDQLRLEIVDSNAEDFVLKLYGRKIRGSAYAATLDWRGRAIAVICRWED